MQQLFCKLDIFLQISYIISSENTTICTRNNVQENIWGHVKPAPV